MTATLSASTVGKPSGLGDSEMAVKIRGISKHFGTGERRVTALRSVDWEVYAGQMSLIVGPSGCGKTTLLSVIAGILNADEGAVTIFDQEVSTMSDRARTRFRAKHIGFVFQQYNLLPGPDGRRERLDPAGHRRLVEGQGRQSGEGGSLVARHGQEDREPSQPALRRPATASRDRPGPSSTSPACWSATSRRPPSTTRPASR